MKFTHFGPLSLCLFLTVSLFAQETPPVDGLFATTTMSERQHLAYPPIREADITYQTKVDRVIDSREKLNLPFRHPEQGFFQAMMAGIENGAVKLYDPAYPAFTQEINPIELRNQLYKKDTVRIYSPIMEDYELQEVENAFDPGTIIRYRIREVTFFDKQTSTQRSRIIAIAPLVSASDEFGNLLYERPIGWIYWPHARQWFDRQPYFLDGTDQQAISWGDIFEMRRFSSYIVKRSNVSEARLQDNYAGRDLLIKSQEVNRDLSNREHDLWSW